MFLWIEYFNKKKKKRCSHTKFMNYETAGLTLMQRFLFFLNSQTVVPDLFFFFPKHVSSCQWITYDFLSSSSVQVFMYPYPLLGWLVHAQGQFAAYFLFFSRRQSHYHCNTPMLTVLLQMCPVVCPPTPNPPPFRRLC